MGLKGWREFIYLSIYQSHFYPALSPPFKPHVQVFLDSSRYLLTQVPE